MLKPCCLGLLPLRARLGHGGFVASVEHIDDARIGRGVVELRAVDQEADLRPVRIVTARGKVNGMGLNMTVACRAMGKEALLAIGPQQRVERLDALLACGLHGGTPTAFQRSFEQRRQHLLQRPPLEMIEIDLGDAVAHRWSFPLA